MNLTKGRINKLLLNTIQTRKKIKNNKNKNYTHFISKKNNKKYLHLQNKTLKHILK
jgi:hypothetical protein